MFGLSREEVLIVGLSLLGFTLLQVVETVRSASPVRIIQEPVEEVVIIVDYRKTKTMQTCKERENKHRNRFIFKINIKNSSHL